MEFQPTWMEQEAIDRQYGDDPYDARTELQKKIEEEINAGGVSDDMAAAWPGLFEAKQAHEIKRDEEALEYQTERDLEAFDGDDGE